MSSTGSNDVRLSLRRVDCPKGLPYFVLEYACDTDIGIFAKKFGSAVIDKLDKCILFCWLSPPTERYILHNQCSLSRDFTASLMTRPRIA